LEKYYYKQQPRFRDPLIFLLFIRKEGICSVEDTFPATVFLQCSMLF